MSEPRSPGQGMQLDQHTGQGGELLSSPLLTPAVLSLSYCEAADPSGPKSDFTENTFQIMSLISPATINIVSCAAKCFIFPHTKNNL